jgi:hypothetical protein
MRRVHGMRGPTYDAMRRSLYSEHKLSFRDFLASQAGAPLLRAAAQATGIDVTEFRTATENLPELDFYVPSGRQRMAWQGTADYAVAVGLNGTAPRTGYVQDGSTVPLELSAPGVPPVTVIMLQTAERKSLRVDPQPEGPGLVIQDPGDGQLSGTLMIREPSGATTIINLADFARSGLPLAQCIDPECSGGGGGGGGGDPPPSPETFLESISTTGICDNGNCSEGNEFEFRGMTPDGTTEAIRVEGIPSTAFVHLHQHLIYALPPMWVGGEGGAIAARETDSFNADDYFFYTDLNYCGAVRLNFLNDNGALWYLTEGTCDPQAPKPLVVRYTW